MTVLHRLKKFKHPAMCSAWKRVRHIGKNGQWQFHNQDQLRWAWYYYDESIGDELVIQMHFKEKTHEYSFWISKDFCTIVHNIRENARYTFRDQDAQFVLEKVPYDVLESELFQQSMLGNPGMLDDQAMQMLREINAIYFGKKR